MTEMWDERWEMGEGCERCENRQVRDLRTKCGRGVRFGQEL